MNRMFQTMIFFVILAAGAGAQNNAVYIYRNDGSFNAFFKNMIDSITYSHYDADSLYNQDWKTQVVYTPDSVYKIPLAVVDSVSFIAPETIVNSNVFELTAEHDQFLSECDTISFTLSPTTPSNMRPVKNSIVVSRYDCMSFPDGIMAKVISVSSNANGHHYNCQKVGLESVYDRLVCISEGFIYGDENQRAKNKVNQSLQHTLWNESYDKTLESNGTTTNFSINDVARIIVTVNIEKGKIPFFCLELQNDLKTEVSFNASSSFEKYYETCIAKVSFPRIRIPQCPLLFIVPKLSLSAYFAESATVNLDCQAHYNRTDKVSFIYENNTWRIFHAPTNDAAVDVAYLSMEGSVEVGVIPDILFSFCGSATGLGIEYTIGLKELVNFNFDAVKAFDTGMYYAMKDSYARTTLPQSFRAYASFGFWGNGVQPISYKYSIEHQLGTDKYLLPLFTKPTYTKGVPTKTAILKSGISRDLLIPVQVGMAFYDEDDKLIETQYLPSEYISEDTWGLNGLECAFDKMEAGHRYIAYPLVKIMNKELRALPYGNFPKLLTCPDSNHPHAIDLGLPSGTLWACCNVGASAPEKYGGYYAWGETNEKDVYDLTNYAYYNSSTETFTNIGHDIAGTSYDVAHVKMRKKWRMPSSAHIDELLAYCTYQWTAINEVYGIMVKGRNGGRIFLPAAGDKGGNYGLECSYNSSTSPIPSGDGDNNIYLYYNSAWEIPFDWDSWHREIGRSVRAVCPYSMDYSGQ